ncbi:unnamed protein product [Toxocara canis]|uniref:Kinetochore protein SPC25 n=1 Tax=Toxocara canis TaxID=6265 RepID=A0A183UDN1_TOXCA|nr:unnamed protein product [Toxocara canis]
MQSAALYSFNLGDMDCKLWCCCKKLGAFVCSRRLREVCRVLQETQQRVIDQKDEIDALLLMDAQYRDSVSAVQAQTVVLRSLEMRIERAKCRLMTVRMKLIRVHDDKRNQEVEHEERTAEIKRIDEEVTKRTETLSAIRETISHTASQLVLRQRRMLKDLMDIYLIDVNGVPQNRLLPLPCVCRPAITIAGLHLPDAVASLVNFFASRSTLINPLTAEIFPLYALSKNRDKLEEAVHCLNKNIGQLRCDCGLATRDIGRTLSNLHDLLMHLTV